MKKGLNKNSIGLIMGVFMGAIHFVWLILVALGVAKALSDWILTLHHIKISFAILPFDIVSAVLLLVIVFIGSYIFGWIFAVIWNAFCKSK